MVQRIRPPSGLQRIACGLMAQENCPAPISAVFPASTGVHSDHISRTVLDPSFLESIRIQRDGGVCYFLRTSRNDEFCRGRLFSSRVDEVGLRINLLIGPDSMVFGNVNSSEKPIRLGGLIFPQTGSIQSDRFASCSHPDRAHLVIRSVLMGDRLDPQSEVRSRVGKRKFCLLVRDSFLTFGGVPRARRQYSEDFQMSATRRFRKRC